MKQTAYIVFLLVLLPLFSNAQFDSILNSFQAEFDSFKAEAEKEQQNFINKNDSLFLNFLNEAWEEVDVFIGDYVPMIKPIAQPKVERIPAKELPTLDIPLIKPSKEDTLELEALPKPVVKPAVKDNTDVEISEPIGAELPESFDSQTIINPFDFYGSRENVYYSPRLRPTLDDVDQDDIVDFYSDLAKNAKLWDANVKLLTNAKNKYLLNDWGYYQLAKAASESIFEDSNEQRLFTWYLLLKSGYNVKVGYTNDEVFLLLPSYQKLFSVLYLSDHVNTYYILDSNTKKLSNLRTYSANYPGSANLFSFNLESLPNFTGDKIAREITYKDKTIQLQFENNDLDYLSSYPHCELSSYFLSGISKYNWKQLDELLLPLLDGKTDRQKVDELLHFIQLALEYATDQEQFGKERYLYAEESLYYPFCDCEDRSILLAELVNRYLKLPIVGLDFPGHIATAIHIPGEEDGAHITFNGKKYLVCDPTYINANAGMIPPDLKNEQIEIIAF